MGLGGPRIRWDDADMEYLNAVEAELKSVSPGMEGKLWSRTAGNKFDTTGDDTASWILQVPDCWGWTASKGIPAGAEKPGIKKLLNRLRHNLAQATKTVDITGFGPPDMIGSPPGRSRTAISSTPCSMESRKPSNAATKAMTG